MAPATVTDQPTPIDINNDTADMQTTDKLTIRQPDDMHVHLRDGAMMRAVVSYTARQFGRAIIMPNLKPPVRTLADAQDYHARITGALSLNNSNNNDNQQQQQQQSSFTPLMTLYLTDTTSVDDIRAAKASGLVHSCKLYPAGATTNSAFGVTSVDKIDTVLEAMQACDLVLCIHGEVTDPDVDIFDREARFMSYVLPRIVNKYPTLRIVLEHVTTKEAVEFVSNHPGDNVAASVTAHHLLYSRMALFEGAKLHPHMFCLPVLKRDLHRQAILSAIANDTKGRFFAGTDSAPHTKNAKQCSEACAGIFTAHAAVALYAEAFDHAGMLHKLEDFCSVNAAKFYKLPLNEKHITLTRCQSKVMHEIPVDGMEPIIPLRAGQCIEWAVSDVDD